MPELSFDYTLDGPITRAVVRILDHVEAFLEAQTVRFNYAFHHPCGSIHVSDATWKRLAVEQGWPPSDDRDTSDIGASFKRTPGYATAHVCTRYRPRHADPDSVAEGGYYPGDGSGPISVYARIDSGEVSEIRHPRS